MDLFESTLILLVIAVALVRVADRLAMPYPSMLALAGGCVAAIPGMPTLSLEPHFVLALFVAPAALDAAYELPLREIRRNWVPLTSLAVLLVMATAGAVAWFACTVGAMPVAAAVALGAIVAPPDAAAATAVLQRFNLPRRAVSVLQGESLLNDAVALLIFGVAVGLESGKHGASATLPSLLIAVPGGIALGLALGALGVFASRKLAGSPTAIIYQFVGTFGAWLLADRLHLSSIMAVVALGMVSARYVPARMGAHDRVNANAVWAVIVFVLNVLAFLLMGLQARAIVTDLDPNGLRNALIFAGAVLAIVIVVRIVWVMAYGWLVRKFAARRKGESGGGLAAPGARVGLLVSWCGMRGLVTLATALALPDDFPSRNVIVLSAFAVVLGTLIFQGLTMSALIGWLDIAPDESLGDELRRVRNAMLREALAALEGKRGEAADALRSGFAQSLARTETKDTEPSESTAMRLAAIEAQRRLLIEWRDDERLDDDVFHRLESELDWAEIDARAAG
ncbi:MAG: cation:proton antiporter [Burkholderiaceae bacterium]